MQQPKPTATDVIENAPFGHLTRATSFFWVAVAYAVAIAAGYLYTQWFAHPTDARITLWWADVVATCVIFIFSFIFRNSSFYDAYWTVIPPLFGLYYLAFPTATDVNQTRAYLAMAATCLWGLRLTYNWIRYWEGLGHEDWRYVKLRKDSGKLYWLVSFSGLHMFPTILVYFSSLALYPTMATSNAPLNVWDFVGFAVAVGAALLEWTADEQLYRFRQNPANRGKTISIGVWTNSRHPNYLGEISFWYGLAFMAMAATGWAEWYIYFIGAVAIHGMFYFITLPMADQRNLTRKAGYAERMAQTNKLLPWPPKK